MSIPQSNFHSSIKFTSEIKFWSHVFLAVCILNWVAVCLHESWSHPIAISTASAIAAIAAIVIIFSINHCICPHHRTGPDWPPFSSETIRIFVSQLKIFRTSCIDRYDFHTYKFLLLFCTRRSLTHFHEKVLPSPQWSVGPVYVGPTQRSTTNKLPVMNSMRGKGCTKGPNSLQCFQWEEVQ